MLCYVPSMSCNSTATAVGWLSGSCSGGSSSRSGTGLLFAARLPWIIGKQALFVRPPASSEGNVLSALTHHT